MSDPLWLASRSPRRRQLLEWAGYHVEAHPTGADETYDPSDPPEIHARKLAERKLAAGRVAAPPGRLVLAADSVVHARGRIFDTPRDREEAVAHLVSLSGGWHEVTTGVAIGNAARLRSFTVTTRVRFRDLGPPEILAYVGTGEADDKAGAYGIQGRGGTFVAEIFGSWTNVMGLPIEETLRALSGDFGLLAGRSS